MPPRLRRLTPEQYKKATGALGASPPNPFAGASGGGIYPTDVTELGLAPYEFFAVMSSAEQAAPELVAKLKATNRCLAGPGLDRACVETAIRDVGGKAFRRPLVPDEVSRYSDAILAAAATDGADAALELGLAALMSSPYFLFRWEVGGGAPDAAGRVMLTPYEIAVAISFTLTDGPPDAELWSAAASGNLASAEQARVHVKRLLGPNGDGPQSLEFFRRYVGYGSAAGKVQYGGRVAALAIPDTDALVKDNLGRHRSFVETLFSDPGGYMSKDSALYYGAGATSSSPKPERVAFPAGQRAGVLTQPAFLMGLGKTDDSDPIHRGRFIREMVLCQSIPNIPLSAIPAIPQMANATWREKLQAHSDRPACSGCHSLMDPLGLALEQYDALGGFRVTAGQPWSPKTKVVDASGVLTGAGSEDGPFSGAVELAQRLSRSPIVKQCFLRQSFRYWLGRLETASDACAFKAAEDRFAASGGDAVELFATLLSSDTFLYRREGASK